MTSKHAEYLAGLFQSLSYKDKVIGLVTPIKVPDGERMVTIPAVYDPSHEWNDRQSYVDAVPNSKYKSIIYFEDLGTRLEETTSHRMKFKSRLRIVCWYNYKKLNIGMYNDFLLIGEMVKLLRVSPVDSVGYMQKVWYEFDEQEEKDGSIFDKYDYDDRMQYLTYPYDYFSFIVTAEFFVTNDCLTVVTLNPEQC